MSDYQMVVDYIYSKNDIESISTIVEFGSRDGLDAVFLAEKFPNANIITFECNPRQIDECIKNIELSNYKHRIKFIPNGVGDKQQSCKFYFYPENVGASSLFIHNDKSNENDYAYINIVRAEDELKRLGVHTIDLLCMDIQGYEPFALIGLGKYLNGIKYIQSEIYSNDNFTSYIGSPSRNETINILNNFNLVSESRFGIEANAIFKNKDIL